MSEARKITLQFPSLRAFLAEYGERISAEGMLLRTEAPPAAGSTVDIEVVVAAGMRLLRARGETLWSGAGAAGGRQPAAAVRFQDLDEASRKLIEKIVEQRRREGAEPFRLADVPGPREARLLDLTMPMAPSAAGSAQPEAPSPDGIFDLAQAPTAREADLFETAGPQRKLKAPVPLLAGPEPDPFDLGPLPPRPEEGIEATDSTSGQPPGGAGQPAGLPAADLNNLFDADEPREPARARTWAFPPSFVDEVEAELQSAEEPDSTFLDVDTSELEMQLGAPVSSPAPVSGPPRESAPAPPVEPAGEAEPAAKIELELEVEDEPPLTPARETARVAEAFDAAQGPETVEIPILDSPSPSPPASPVPEPLPPPAGPAPESSPPESGVAPPPVVGPPATPARPPGAPASEPVAPMDDNLLSLPELGSDPSAAAAEPAVPVELPSSAQALRGAAGSSRRLGTWMLIALLAGALGVAGYLLWGLTRGDEGTQTPGDRAAAPVTEPAQPAAEPAEPAGEAGVDTAGEDAAPSPPAAEEEPPPEVEAEAAVAASQVEPAAAEPVEPADPFTGLDRINWNELGSETVLSLVADGVIARRSVELVTIGGAQPRLVIKIAGVQRPFQPAVLEVGTAHVDRVRTGLHAGGELHVVVDLAAAGVAVRDLAVGGGRVKVRLGTE
jgi:uncharacterized protein (TIGR02266 family)